MIRHFSQAFGRESKKRRSPTTTRSGIGTRFWMDYLQGDQLNFTENSMPAHWRPLIDWSDNTGTGPEQIMEAHFFLGAEVALGDGKLARVVTLNGMRLTKPREL